MSTFGSNFIFSLKPAKYNYIPSMAEEGIDVDKVHFGIMAQNIQSYLESVSNEDFNIVQKDKNGKLMVNYNELIGPMIKTIQEMAERIDTLETKLKGQ